MASGPYVLLGDSTTDVGTLIDNRDNQRSQVALPPACPFTYGNDVLGGPWLLRVCGANGQPDPWLYSLAQRTWRDIGTPAGLLQALTNCATVAPCSLGGSVVGSDWIGWSFSCPGHCAGLPLGGFSNVQTGAWQSLAGSATTIYELAGSTTTIYDPNSASLTVKLCRPLKLPPGASITFYGRFAVLDQDRLDRPDYLERCGSHIRQRISGDTTGDPHVVIANPGTTKLDGIFLPSRRHFVISLSHDMPGGSTEFLLSDHTLYANSGSRVWTAPVPTLTRSTRR
jgi:hypothetical protein